MIARRAVLPTLATALLAGCGTADDREQARATVERFHAAVDAGDGDAACAELTADARQTLESQMGRSCRRAITRLSHEGGAVVAVEVFVKNARVVLGSGESAFLGREPRGWRLSAVGCRPEEGKPRDRPFECELEV